jgi:hypothetical protein
MSFFYNFLLQLPAILCKKKDMNPIRNLYPSVGRKDAGLIVIKQLTLVDNIGQASVAEMLLGEIENNPWPDGLLSHNVHLGNDGTGVLLYAQWIDKVCHDRYEKNQTAARQNNNAEQYVLYRSMADERQSKRVPGCVVIVRQSFTKSGIASGWIDRVFEAIHADVAVNENSGGISGHFHISIDGHSMVNFAEWTNEEAHKQALLRSGNGTVGRSELWKSLFDYPGAGQPGSFKRYTFYSGLGLAS